MFLKQQLSEPFRPAFRAHFLLALSGWQPDTKYVRTIFLHLLESVADITFKGSAMPQNMRSWKAGSSIQEFLTKKNLCHTHDFHGMTFKPHCWKFALEFQPFYVFCQLRSSLLKAPQYFPGFHNSSSSTTPSGLKFSSCLRNLKHLHLSQEHKEACGFAWYCIVQQIKDEWPSVTVALWLHEA